MSVERINAIHLADVETKAHKLKCHDQGHTAREEQKDWTVICAIGLPD